MDVAIGNYTTSFLCTDDNRIADLTRRGNGGTTQANHIVQMRISTNLTICFQVNIGTDHAIVADD